MNNFLRASGLAAAMALAPLASSAATLNPANTLESGETYDINESPYNFAVVFTSSDTAGSYFFEFVNDSTTAVALSVAVSAFNQLALKFTGGGTVAWSGGESMAFSESTTIGDAFGGVAVNTTIDRGETERLTLSFGDPSAVERFGVIFDGEANINLSVVSVPSAVPVPAAGFLLVGALGGLAALRRRRKAAA